MATDVLQLARLRCAEIEREIQVLQEEASRLQLFIQTGESLRSGDTGKPSKTTPESKEVAGGGTKTRPAVRDGTHAAFTARLLTEKGPLPLHEIVEAMIKAGRGNEGDEIGLAASVNSALWRRSDLFARRDDGCYYLHVKSYTLLPAKSGTD
jgi:hypothetical protein